MDLTNASAVVTGGAAGFGSATVAVAGTKKRRYAGLLKALAAADPRDEDAREMHAPSA
jgi:NAD(P)-dependent dehydrogenase (short-subunit alcohol dehydrogenase family)